MRRRGGLPPDPEEAAALEVEHHLAELVDRLVETGRSREAALAEATRRFGDLERYRGKLKRTEKRRRRMMRRIEAWGFLKGATVQVFRTVRHYPGFAAGVVLALALGVGAPSGPCRIRVNRDRSTPTASITPACRTVQRRASRFPTSSVWATRTFEGQRGHTAGPRAGQQSNGDHER